MKTLLLTVVVVLALTVVAGQALAQGCHSSGPTTASGHHGNTGGAQAGQCAHMTPPPAENMISLTGTVVSIAKNGAALVDTGTAKVYVMSCETMMGGNTPSPFKVGDRVQVAGVLAAFTVQPAAAAGGAATNLQQARFQVDNILCGACSTSVQKALQAAPGVKQVSVTTAGIATVGYDPAVTNPQTLAGVIAHAKHPHQGMTFKATLLH
jgi:copper chaperone CopZ